MGFKADTSFLRFLSMGAAGARRLMTIMKEAGFEPIELERYCTSNKIWATKVKRLRLPDALCVRTGLRVEVRAKSDLQIRMSDAPGNPDRRWDVGMRDEDLAAFIACSDDNGTFVPATEPVFFTYRDLRKSETKSRLSDPKAASEGTETARTWPSIVPKRNGVVTQVDKTTIRVTMDKDDERAERPQTFQLRDRTSYVAAGDRFIADASILAGVPTRRAELKTYLSYKYDPLGQINSKNDVDRYAAVKALPFLPELKSKAVEAIAKRLDAEKEDRILLEAAGSGITLGVEKAWDKLESFVWSGDRADLRMEAVFILTESKSVKAVPLLRKIAKAKEFAGNEIRQAAVWGLGKAGHKNYVDLAGFLNDPEGDVVLHAIAGFGSDAGPDIISLLVNLLERADLKEAAAASEALRIIGNDAVLQKLIEAAKQGGPSNWILATLGRLSPAKVRAALGGDPLLNKLEPLFLMGSSENWLAKDSVDIDLKFLLKQNL
ncbi:MAG: HEAT repeat domain-containing protein [Bradyrhizobium sp.]